MYNSCKLFPFLLVIGPFLYCSKPFSYCLIQVVHPAPGNATGTLVNGILHHCSLSTYAFNNQEVLSEMEDTSDDEFSCFSPGRSCNEDVSSAIVAASVRPGIVHRLDKGTSGLLVVAKVCFCLANCPLPLVSKIYCLLQFAEFGRI